MLSLEQLRPIETLEVVREICFELVQAIPTVSVPEQLQRGKQRRQGA